MESLNLKTSNLGTTLGTAGVLGGIFYAMKEKKSFGVLALYAIGFGIGGMFIGNTLSKMGA